jgi:3-keto-L-gulonate-6-phosphate decarboxylase
VRQQAAQGIPADITDAGGKPVTVKQLLEAIEDSKINATLVVQDKGHRLAVTEIRAGEHIVTLVCRPRTQTIAERLKSEENATPLRAHDLDRSPQ